MSRRAGQTTEALIDAETARLGLDLSAEQRTTLGRYLKLLARWGQKINLVGRPQPEALVKRHLADGLLLAREARGFGALPGEGVDVGSGAGLPGVVVQIAWPELALTLCEPRKKRAAFLRTVAAGLGLRYHVIEARADLLERGAYGLALSQATFAPAEWLPLGRQLVTVGGLVALLLGRERGPERVEGMRRVARRNYRLSDGSERSLELWQRE